MSDSVRIYFEFSSSFFIAVRSTSFDLRKKSLVLLQFFQTAEKMWPLSFVRNIMNWICWCWNYLGDGWLIISAEMLINLPIEESKIVEFKCHETTKRITNVHYKHVPIAADRDVCRSISSSSQWNPYLLSLCLGRFDVCFFLLLPNSPTHATIRFLLSVSSARTPESVKQKAILFWGYYTILENW